MSTNKKFRQAYCEWLISLKPNVFMTFNFGYRISPEVGNGHIRKFFNRLQRRVHGRNWSYRETNRYMTVSGLWEHHDSNPHCHTVGRLSKKEWRWLVENDEEFWLELQPRGQLDFSKIESLEKVISYITKEYRWPDSQETMFAYKAPLDKA